ncbi:MAG: hypothetical protein AAGL49_14355 [Pseudomonadota bacterium]
MAARELNRLAGVLGLGESTNIRIGVGEDRIGAIDAPGPLRGDVSNLEYRIAIANNAFNWMRANVHGDPAVSKRHREFLDRLHHGELVPFPSPVKPRAND